MSKHDEQYISKFQNSKFKVWVHVEEINEDEDYYQDVGEPISIGEFDDYWEARFAMGDLLSGFRTYKDVMTLDKKKAVH